MDTKIDPQSAFAITLANLLKNIHRFVSVEQPFSKKADEKGTDMGQFLVDNAVLAIKVEEKRVKLMEHLKPHVDVEVTYFSNWAGTATECVGLMLIVKPKTVHDVCNIVKGAIKYNLKVGCGGSYHSWSPLFPDKSTEEQVGILINICDLQLESDKRIMLNYEKMEVTISSGVTTGELQQFFLNTWLSNDMRVCFPSDVNPTNLTYGGVLTTGCHGSGKDQPTMSDWITSMKLVDHIGTLRSYPDDLPKDVNKTDAMNALRVSLGVFGVVVEMTLKVVPMPTARIQTDYKSLGALLYGDNPRLLEVLREAWSVQVMWFPFNSLGMSGSFLEALPNTSLWQPEADELWIQSYDPLDEYHETNKLKILEKKLVDTVSHIAMNSLGTPMISEYPSIIPCMNMTSFSIVKHTYPPGITRIELPYAIHYMYGLSYCPTRYMEFAFSFNMDTGEGFPNVLKAMKCVVEQTRKDAEGSGPKVFPLTISLCLRVISKGESLLSPAAKIGSTDPTTHTAYLELIDAAHTHNMMQYYKSIAEQWMKLGGIPHWTKLWTQVPGVFPHVRAHFGKNLTTFKKILRKLGSNNSQELSKIFINSTMERLLEV